MGPAPFIVCLTEWDFLIFYNFPVDILKSEHIM